MRENDVAGTVSDAPPSAHRIDRRRLDIERAKGLAIILVVFGHVAARDVPTLWFDISKSIVYTFHMPLFFYLSGYVFSLSSSIEKAESSFFDYVSKRSDRLLKPFALMAVVVILGKMAAAFLAEVDNPVISLSSALYHLIIGTDRSVVLFIWYVFVLLIFSIVTPIAFKILKHRWWLVAIAAILVHFAPVPDVLYLNRAGNDWIFFVVGAWAAASGDVWISFLRRFCPLSWVIFVLAIGVVWSFSLYDNARLAMGMLSIFAVHGLFLVKFQKDKIFLFFGTYAFAIYLFNMIFIGVGKAVWSRLVGFEGLEFTLGVPVIMAVAIAGPILLKRLVLSRVPALDRMTS